MEEIELQDRSGVRTRLSPAPVDKTELQQESTFTKFSCKICSRSLQEPRLQSCCGQHVYVCESCTPENEPCPHCGSAREDDLTETCEMVKDTRKRRKTSVTVEPTADPTSTGEPVTKRLRSAAQTKVKVPICKERIKSGIESNIFYTSNGYNMQIEFRYKASKDYRNNVYVYVYTCQGKNDEKLIWPLKGKVRIFIDLGGVQHQISEISGTWNKPPPRNHCKGELNIPYEDLKEDYNGMLQFYVTDD